MRLLNGLIICSILGLASVLPAHAIPITVDSATRSVGASTTITPTASVSSSTTTGLFSETATSSGFIEAGPISASANQISTISLLGNNLTVTDAGSATLLTTAFSSDPREPFAPSAFASSMLSLQFTLDNWASYSAVGVINAVGPSFSFMRLAASTSPTDIFSFASSGNSTGLLGPGMYAYGAGTSAVFLSPDRGSLSSSVFSLLTVSIVPEPSTVYFLILALAGLGWVRFKGKSWIWNERRFTNGHLLPAVSGLLVLGLPCLIEASPITPDPNPVGSTINIINDQTASTGGDAFFLNAGTINNDSSSKLTISAPLANAGALNNYGQVAQLNITNTGTINNFGGFTDVGNYGTLTNAVGATLNNYGGILMGPLGPAFIANAGTLNNFSGSSIIGTFGGGSVGNTGILNNFAGAELSIFDGGLGNAVGATINNSGTMLAWSMTNDGTLNNAGSFICCTSGTLPFVNSVGATIINSGTMQLCCLLFSNGGTLVNTGSVVASGFIFNGGTLINNGTLQSSAFAPQLINTGLLRGNGTVIADVTHSSGALLAPGDSSVLGKFTIHGNLQSSGDVLFRIQGLNVGQFDVLDISDTATFNGGKMTFAFSGFTPKIGDSWDFLYASAINGWDSLTFLFNGLDSTERAMFHFHDGIETLRIVAVPEPNSFLFLVTGIVGIALLHKRKAALPIVAGAVWLVPLPLYAAQIAPNPNPAGSTIDIISDPTASNSANPFINLGTIDIDSSSTLTNTGVIGSVSCPCGGFISNAGILNNYGGLIADTGSITNSGTLNNFGGVSTNDGATLTNTLGATLNNYGGIGNGVFGGSTTNAGTLNNYGSLANFAQGHTTNSGTLNSFVGSSITVNDGSFANLAGGIVNNYGTMSFIEAGITNNGVYNNFGSWTGGANSGVSNSLGATLTNFGSINLSGVISGFSNAGTMINVGSIQLDRGFSNSGILVNIGSMTTTSPGFLNIVGNAGTLINTGLMDQLNYAQSAGVTINNGTMTASPLTPGFGFDIQGGTLRGTGTVNAFVTIASGAVLAPGDATVLGKFTIHGSLQSSGDFLFRIQGLNVGQFDVLDISDTSTFTGGTMRFSFTGFDPHIGDSWDFLYASAITGWNSLSFLFTGLDSTERAMFHFHDGIESLRIVAVPEPGSILLLSAALVGMAGWRRLTR